MLEYYEVDPLPEVCLRCLEAVDEEDGCYNCDYAMERWHLTPESEQRLEELFSKRRERASEDNQNRRQDFK